MIEVISLSAFNDNYIWLIKNCQTLQCAAVDPGDATPVLSWLQANPNWQLTDILITHHHQDHTGGVAELKEKTNAKVFASENSLFSGKNYSLTDLQTLQIIGCDIKAITTPGHTLDHIAYYIDLKPTPWLFSGDTLFVGGCGRIFEGTYQQMYESLQRLAVLPPETLVYCAHEYTVSNLRFADTVEPNNNTIKQHLNNCIKLTEKGQSTVPSSIYLEIQTNPFLRCNETEVIEAAEQFTKRALNSPTEIFAALREWKNNF